MPMRFISGATDGLVKYWTFSNETKKFAEETVAARADWIKDVAFAQHNTMGLALPVGYYGPEEGNDTIAVCGEKSGVSVLRRSEEKWEECKLAQGEKQAVRLSWSADGGELSVAYEDGTVAVAEENEPGKWDFASKAEEPKAA